MANKYDVAVLGGGPGGYVAAIRAAQLGYKTVVIDKDNLGGICLNWGCIPTKSLIKNAELYDAMKNHAKDFGLKVEGLSYDFAAIIKRSRKIANRISKNVDYLIRTNEIERVKGIGKLVSKNEIGIFDSDSNQTDTIEANKIILATGASPKIVPPIPVDRENIITSKEAMNLPEQPESLIVIGAGAIGVEFAYFYHTFGTKVTIIEMMDNILPIEDEEVSKTLENNFKKSGMEIFTSTKVDNAKVVDGEVVVTIEKDGEKQELRATKVLSAIGVSGNVNGLGLEDVGVDIENGHIKVNYETYQTSIDNIYAVGDVIGAPWLAHVASAEAITCVERMKGEEVASVDYGKIPGCTYCQPQVASIGLTEQKAKEEGYELKIGKFPFSASGKAFASGEREGFVKLIFDAKYGELLGAHIIGSEATELIAEAGLAMSMEATYESIIKTIHAHPTLSEAVMEAAANAYGESVHI